MNQDKEHLKLLSIFHYIVGGLGFVFSSLWLAYVAMGIFFIAMPEKTNGFNNNEIPPPFVGWFLVILGGALVLLGWTISLLFILSGRYLARQKHHFFCLVIAGIGCLAFPFGTVLGVFTFVILSRPSVKELFMPSFAPNESGPGQVV
ncbi:MAG: hypothetical protein WC980_04570 [Candidatus Brocadiia bacterium]